MALEIKSIMILHQNSYGDCAPSDRIISIALANYRINSTYIRMTSHLCDWMCIGDVRHGCSLQWMVPHLLPGGVASTSEAVAVAGSKKAKSPRTWVRTVELSLVSWACSRTFAMSFASRVASGLLCTLTSLCSPPSRCLFRCSPAGGLVLELNTSVWVAGLGLFCFGCPTDVSIFCFPTCFFASIRSIVRRFPGLDLFILVQPSLPVFSYSLFWLVFVRVLSSKCARILN